VFSSRARQERIEAARRDAIAAKDAAADAFLGLDDAQQMTQAMVEAYAQVEPGPRAQRISGDLAPKVSAGNRASHDYITAMDQHGPVIDESTPDVERLHAAHRAFHDAWQHLKTAKDELEQFRARHLELQDRLAEVQSRVQPALNRAAQALTRAREAAAGVRSAGIGSADLDTKLARTEELGQVVSGGAFRSGAQAAIEAAGQLQEAAETVVETAKRLTELKEKGASRLASSRTRLSGIEGRVPQARETLSYLRRTYSMACSEDLDHVPDLALRELAEARRQLELVTGAQEAGNWDAAATQLEQGREHLTTAEEGINAVVARKRDLDDLSQDPAAEKERVRFAIRDAQRLVVSAGAKAPSGEAGILDQLSARVDAVDARLEGTHPDFWGYLVELRNIRDLAAGVVRRTRAALAG